MDYSKMSDFEINRAVGEASGEAKGSEPLLNLVIRNSTGRRYDPCNNPADAWPIIQNNGISLTYDGVDWMAECIMGNAPKYSCDIHKHPGKPLRSAMIVYLMMQEGK